MIAIKRILFIFAFFMLALSCDRVFEPGLQTEVFYHPKFTEEKNQKMTLLLNKIPGAVKVDFYDRFRDWKNTWNDEAYWVCSNPRCWAQSDQYKALLFFAKLKARRSGLWFLKAISKMKGNI